MVATIPNSEADAVCKKLVTLAIALIAAQQAAPVDKLK
jgi:hypothetical protein